MRLFLLFIFLILAVALNAQTKCYNDLRKEGLSLLAKKDYRKAIDKFFAARYCPDKPAKDDLDTQIKKTQDAWVAALDVAIKEAEKQKNRAEIEKKNAIAATREASRQSKIATNRKILNEAIIQYVLVKYVPALEQEEFSKKISEFIAAVEAGDSLYNLDRLPAALTSFEKAEVLLPGNAYTKPKLIKDIIQPPFTDIILTKEQYFLDKHPKTQIVLHHTATPANPQAIIDLWNRDDQKIATAFIISGLDAKKDTSIDGNIVRLFPEWCWAFHLGRVNSSKNNLNQNSIAIELTNYGALTKASDGTYRTYFNAIVPEDQVCVLDNPWRGYIYFHKYSKKQIESLRQLLLYLCKVYDIPKDFHENMFDINEDALNGKPGIWLYANYQPNKLSLFPQPELIEMFKTLVE